MLVGGTSAQFSWAETAHVIGYFDGTVSSQGMTTYTPRCLQ